MLWQGKLLRLYRSPRLTMSASDQPNPALLLQGRRLLVTGGARGLGLAFAEHLAAQGARVVIADLRAELGEQSAATLRAAGHDVQALALDLADPASISACAAQASALLGGLDGLVNNGAITDSGGRDSAQIDIAT